MNTYRIIYADNTVLSCTEVKETTKLEGNYYYEHERNKMIFAVVNAESAEIAQQVAETLVKQVDKNFSSAV